MKMRTWWAWATVGWVVGCVAPSRVSVKPGIDFSKIKAIGVLDPALGEHRAVTDEFVRQLMDRGYSVRVGETAGASTDALLQVSVGQYLPDRKYLVPLRSGDNHHVLVMSPVTEISGRQLYPSMTTAGLADAQVVVSNATVGVSARLVDPASREVWWTGSIKYEGLDLDTAVEGAVTALLKKFPTP